MLDSKDQDGQSFYSEDGDEYGRKDEDEKSDQNGKRQGEGFLAHDGFEEVAEGFDQRFDYGLPFGGENGGFADEIEDERYEQSWNHPTSEHAVGDNPAAAEIHEFSRARRDVLREGGDGESECCEKSGEFCASWHASWNGLDRKEKREQTLRG